MKQKLCLILTLCLLFSSCGGQKSTTDSAVSTLFYMVSDPEGLSEASVVKAETRSFSASSLYEFMQQYFRGPEDETLASPFPPGTEMLSYYEDANRVSLTMSEPFFSLEGVDLSIAACCICKTVCAYMEKQQVVLTDEQGQYQMELEPTQYLLVSDYEEDSGTGFTLYFPDEQHRYLCPESREATLSKNESQADYVLRQLMAGPKADELQAAVPKETKLLGISVENSLCTVDLSSEFFSYQAEDVYEIYTALYGIVNTLTALEEITQVRFLSEGKSVERYGIFSLQEPLVWNEYIVGPIRIGSGEMDVDIYVRSEETGEAFAVPLRVKQTVSEPSAEAVAKAAISFVPPQGFYNAIPVETELLGVSVSGSVCYLDVSSRFVPAEDTPENEQAAVWALVSTLIGVDSISSVVLTIEGESAGLRYVDISEPLDKMSFPD